MNTPSSSQKTIYTKIYLFIKELLAKYTDDYIKCCLIKEEIPEEIHMGVGVEPQFEDFLDDDSYLNVKEFIDKDKNGYLFISNNESSLIKKINKFEKDKITVIKKNIKNAFNKSLNYTDINHYKLLKKFI